MRCGALIGQPHAEAHPRPLVTPPTLNFNLLIFAFAIIAITTAPLQAIDQETFKQRLVDNNAEINKAGKEWFDALVAASGNTNVQPEQVLTFLARLDTIWDSTNRLRHDVSKEYVARIKTFTAKALLNWQDALKAVNSYSETPILLTILVQQETLFDRSRLKPERAATLQARLKRLTPRVIGEWHEASGRFPAFDAAALNLVGIDGVFKDGKLDEDAFRSLVKETTNNNGKTRHTSP